MDISEVVWPCAALIGGSQAPCSTEPALFVIIPIVNERRHRRGLSI